MEAGQFYHLYNRGNNREPIFPKHYNYLYFLRKVKNHFLPHLSILAYCLMPNHFHFLIYTNEDFIAEDFSNDLRIMLSSYTRAINKQEKRVGSLFQQNTKMKSIEQEPLQCSNKSSANFEDYLFTCFHYIHQNPVKAGLVKRMEDWQMSSFKDYSGILSNSICNTELARNFLALPTSAEEFIKESYAVVI